MQRGETTDQANMIRFMLKQGKLSNVGIARSIGCDPGVVRSVKWRMNHPERKASTEWAREHRERHCFNVKRSYYRRRYGIDMKWGSL